MAAVRHDPMRILEGLAVSDAHFALGYETSANGSEWTEVMKAVFRRVAPG